MPKARSSLASKTGAQKRSPPEGESAADGKSSFAALVAQLRPSIEELFNKVLAIPCVSDIVKPVIDGLRAKLDALSKA